MTEEQRSMMCVILKRHGRHSEHFKVFKGIVEGRVVQSASGSNR